MRRRTRTPTLDPPAPLRSMILLGGSSAFGVVVGVLAAKGWALRVGPTGLGIQAVITSLAGLASVVATMGTGAGLVRRAADLISTADEPRLGSVRRAAWTSTLVFVTATSAGLLIAGPWLRRAFLHRGFGLPGLAALAVLSAALSAQSLSVATLNAYRRVRALAWVNGLTSAASAIIGLALVVAVGTKAIPTALALGGVAAALVAAVAVRRAVPRTAGASAGMIATDSRAVLRFGVPYTASTLLSSGVILVLPLLVASSLGRGAAGQYRAASTISIGYVGFILIALAQDFYPRASLLRESPVELGVATRVQQRLILGLGGPVVLGGVAFSNVLLPAAYSAAFKPAITVFEWLMLANVFKFASWTLSFVQLARGRTAAYFLTEAVFGAVTVAGTIVALSGHSLAAAGAAVLAGYAVYYAVVLAVVWRDTGYREESRYVVALCLVLISGLAVHSVPAANVASYGELERAALALAGSALCGALLLDRPVIASVRRWLSRSRGVARKPT